MFSIREIKKSGRNAFKRSFIKSVAVFLIVTFLVGGVTINLIDNGVSSSNDYTNRFEVKSNALIVSDFVWQLKGKVKDFNDNILKGATRGVLATIAQTTAKSNSFVFGILNAINQMVFKDKIAPGIVILFGTFIMFVYWYLVSNVIIVGRNRFFLENSCYKSTKIKKILFPYVYKEERNVAKGMFKKNLYIFLWSFTIVGGVIKKYYYAFVSYVLAENPTINSKDALMISKEMTNGYKFKVFLLDLSFIGYEILGILSLNIFNLIYTNPFKACVYSELYLKMRKDYIDKKKYGYELLCDDYLDVSLNEGEYDKGNYFLSVKRMKKEIDNFDINYSFLDIILLFFIYSFLGYLWEVLLHLFSDGVFVNRGTLYGPYLPIYGFGGILSLLLLKKYSSNIGMTFCLSMVLCGIIEYFTSWYLDVLYDMKWWNYTGYLFNLNGRICLEGLIVFGLGCSFSIYFLSPLFKNLFQRVKNSYKVIISIILIFTILIDFVFSVVRPNQGKGISLPNKELATKFIQNETDFW